MASCCHLCIITAKPSNPTLLLRDPALLLPAQAGLDYHKEAALQHAGRSLALAARGDPRLAVPDPPAFARPALDRQTLENKPSKRATRTEATADTVKGRMGREVAVSRTLRPPAPVRDGGWKPRVRSSPAATRRSFAAHNKPLTVLCADIALASDGCIRGYVFTQHFLAPDVPHALSSTSRSLVQLQAPPKGGQGWNGHFGGKPHTSCQRRCRGAATCLSAALVRLGR